MMLESVSNYAKFLADCIWGWPFIIFVAITGIITTFAFNFVQFRYFVESFRYIFAPDQDIDSHTAQNISPLEAFFSALSTSMGNGSLAGMATALFAGGPGAAFWLFVLGFLTMAVRFAEIFASTIFTRQTPFGVRGGPMAYLGLVPGGSFLPYVYAFLCLLLSVVTGNAMQCNSMTVGLVRMTSLDGTWIAAALFLFLVYVCLGGSERVIKYSDAISPIKVVLFCSATLAVLLYNITGLWSALELIVRSAFSTQALSGALLGHTMQNAIRYGVSRTISATEAGLGNAGVLFGATASKNPARSAILSMSSTFIATQIVCFMMMLAFVVSGVWNSGLTGADLVIATYSSVFGTLGGWIATILSCMFGLGVLVAYAFIGLECWLFLTHGRFAGFYYVIYCAMAVWGALSGVDLVWNVIDLITAGLLISNLYGLLCLLPQMRKHWLAYDENHSTR